MTEIARAKIMAVNSVPMEVDRLRLKGNGKGKSKDHQGKPNQGKGAHGKSSWSFITAVRSVTRSPNAYDVSQTLRRRNLKVDLQYLLNLFTRFMKLVTLLPPRLWTMPDLLGGRQASQWSGRRLVRWPVSGYSASASVGNKCHMKGIMLDSGAAVNVCLVDCFPEYGIQSGRHIELQGADGSSVQHYGSRDVLYKVDDEVTKKHFEVTSAKGPIVRQRWKTVVGGLVIKAISWDFVVAIFFCEWTGFTMSIGSSAWRGWTSTGATW